MPLYLTRFSYTADAWAAFASAPADRREGVRKQLAGVGGTLHDVWYTFGEKDGLVLFEAPDDVAATAYLTKTAASGKVHGVETTRLVTVEEMVEALELAATH
jgi:uncharacterized protein with GYD domain